tara:strand:- start:3173 stop:4459 length:1287 start_codon:yes stop_codon:yes gene_type:complete
MKKILIISYFFPPSNITGGYRVFSWAKYLNNFGVYPIIVTRRWDENSEKGIIYKKFEGYEVYYLPYKENLRDKIAKNSHSILIKIFGKLLTLFEIFFQNFFTRAIPYNNLYYKSISILEKDSEIKLIITSAKPFILFKFGYDLQKKFNMPWIADYRDDWSTSQWYNLKGNKDLYTTNKLLKYIESNREKKWLSKATYFTTISNYYTKIIGEFIKKPGFTVMNGYDDEEFKKHSKETYYDEFTITYNGSLYFSQEIEPFLEGLKEVINYFKGKIEIRIYFPGLSDKKQKIRIKSLLKGFEINYIITDRMIKDKIIKIQKKSHLLLMISHKGIKGVTSSKIFEYLGINKPIILFPSDDDVLEKIILSTNSGYIWNSQDEIVNGLKKIISEYIINNNMILLEQNKDKEFYSRKSQTKELADVIAKAIKVYN